MEEEVDMEIVSVEEGEDAEAVMEATAGDTQTMEVVEGMEEVVEAMEGMEEEEDVEGAG